MSAAKRPLNPPQAGDFENSLSRAERRVEFFRQRYPHAFELACYAAFPLTLTSDLLYCLREDEKLQIDCPWYSVPDILLSGLCSTVGHDLYEMEPETTDVLLRQLDETAFEHLQTFLTDYIQYRLSQENSQRPRVLGDSPHPEWISLAFLKRDEAFQTIQAALQQIADGDDGRERFRMAALVERYAELPFLSKFRSQLQAFSLKMSQGEALNDFLQAQEAAKKAGFPELKSLVFRYATVGFAEENTEELQEFEFETVTVNAKGKISQRQTLKAFYFKELLPDKVTTLDMVAIPSGEFMMGSPKGEGYEYEKPQHLVTVPPFFIGKYPITQAQWQAVMETNPSRFKGENRPVETVTWLDATEFCNRLSADTGREYRLPSEAEWEYACRAGTTTKYCFGDAEKRLGDYAWFDQNSDSQTHSVGEKKPNNWGIYDMHGNVWEWCLDHWHDNYEGTPTDGSAWLTDNDDAPRVLRGGSWIVNPWICRSAYRDGNNPGFRYGYFGFRVVCVAPWTL